MRHERDRSIDWRADVVAGGCSTGPFGDPLSTIARSWEYSLLTPAFFCHRPPSGKGDVLTRLGSRQGVMSWAKYQNLELSDRAPRSTVRPWRRGSISPRTPRAIPATPE